MKENTFEDNLKELEQLSEKIKSGDLPLSETINSFEKGMKLANSLEKEISTIERKVEILVDSSQDPDETGLQFKDFKEE